MIASRVMQIVSIQHLRGIAALMVVVFHLGPQLERMGVTALPPNWLAAGVDLFFVISGFIMWWTTYGVEITPGRFMLKRIHRIVPLYWAISSFYVLVLLVAPRFMQSGAFDPAHVAASYFFLPWPHPVVDANHPLVTPGWTLNYEMFFYLVFAVGLFLPGRRARLAAVAAMLCALVLAGLVFRPQGAQLQAYTATILLEFLFGMGIAALAARGALLPAAAALACIALGAAAWVGFDRFNTQGTRFLFWGLPAMLIVYGAVSWERRRSVPAWPLLLLFGNASYSIYISHQLSLSAAGQAWRRAVGDLPPLAATLGFGLFGVVVSVVVGLLCYALVERPLGRWTGRLLPGSGGAPIREPVHQPVQDPVPAPAAERAASL